MYICVYLSGEILLQQYFKSIFTVTSPCMHVCVYVSVNLASQQFFVCSQSSPEKRNLQDLYREREKEIYLSELAHVDCGCLANGVSQQAGDSGKSCSSSSKAVCWLLVQGTIVFVPLRLSTG